MPNLGTTEILIILAIVLLLFGANKLPDLARSMGRSARIFKSEVKEMRREDMEDNVHGQTVQQGELPPATTSQATNSVNTSQPVQPVQQPVHPTQPAQPASQSQDFWDRPENQPQR